MKKPEGFFIVIEGIDGAGTTTQAGLLHKYFRRSKISSSVTFEPTDGPVGKLIRDVLAGRIWTSSNRRKIILSEKTLCLLFAADRQEHSGRISADSARGVHTICDRYILSSLAYQTLGKGITASWVVQSNRGCARPDLTLLLKVPAEECAKRLRNRKETPTIYEKKETLAAIDRNYDKMFPVYRRHFGPLVTINGRGTVEEVQAEIQKAVHFKLHLPFA